MLAAVMMLAACTKEGDTIYEWDPNEPKASTKPLVTVIYGQDALGDRSYNDAAAGSTPAVAATKQNPRWEKSNNINNIKKKDYENESVKYRGCPAADGAGSMGAGRHID